MKNFTIQNISVEILEVEFEHTDRPHGADSELTGVAKSRAIMKSSDNWQGHFAVINYQKDMVFGKFFWTQLPAPEPYSRLIDAGSVSVLEHEGNWVCLLRVMKLNEKGRPNLFNTSLEELDALCSPESFTDLVSSIGEANFGQMSSLIPGHRSNALAMSVPAGEITALSAMIAVTRPIALSKRISV